MKKPRPQITGLLNQNGAAVLSFRAARNVLYGSHNHKTAVEKNALAASLLVAAILLGSGMAIVIRFLEGYSAFQIVFLRSAIVVSVLLPILTFRGSRFWDVARPRLLFLRGLLGSIGQTLTVMAVLSLPLATFQALSFSRAFMVVALGVLVLGEIVTWRRWAAVALGFVGVLIVVDPLTAYNSAAFYALGGTFAFACALLLTKVLLKSESRGTLMLWNAGTHFTVSLIPALLTWSQPTGWDPLLFLALGAIILVVQPISLQAFRLGEISALAPIDYLRILTGAASGFFVFGEKPGASFWVGALVIIGANVWIQRQNAQS